MPLGSRGRLGRFTERFRPGSLTFDDVAVNVQYNTDRILACSVGRDERAAARNALGLSRLGAASTWMRRMRSSMRRLRMSCPTRPGPQMHARTSSSAVAR